MCQLFNMTWLLNLFEHSIQKYLLIKRLELSV